MKSIAFTDKQEHVFTRFNALRRAYEDANGGGRVYNPDFLTVLMNVWEERPAVYAAMQDIEKDMPRKSLQDHIRERRERLNNSETETE